MSSVANQKILLGICGGIAAYKCPEIVRELRRAGAEVRVVMTAGAEAFVTPLSLQTVSGHPVHQFLLDDQQEAAMSHIELARWAERILIAPATAHFMAKLAHGLADDLLSTLCLATTAPVMIAPAMNQQMWHHPATQTNLELLKARGVEILGPGIGEQACGEFGPGRMLEPTELLDALSAMNEVALLKNLDVLITAGPTQEPIDPVRFISNQSSGKMGYALAEAARRAGANVTLISGPTHLSCSGAIKRIDVRTADQMYDAVHQHLPGKVLFISTAAVTDYRPAQPSDQKIKTSTESISLDCTKNRDILASISECDQRPFTVGFAAETQNLIPAARQKLAQKKCDLIIANDVSGDLSPFGRDENEVTVLSEDQAWTFERQPKQQLAGRLMTLISQSMMMRNKIPS